MEQQRQNMVLISVANKTGLIDIGKRFVALGNWRILSSGGTGKALSDAGIPVITTAEFSGQCMAEKLMRDDEFLKFMDVTFRIEANSDFMARFKKVIANGLQVGAMFDHRLATISAPLYGGLLSDANNEGHMAELAAVGWGNIDMVICDFYPLAKTLAKPGVTLQDVIASWDVGGPFMIDAAAKSDRLPICRVDDRDMVLKHLEANGVVPPEVRMQLRQTAVFEVGRYYMDLAQYLGPDRFDAMVGEKVRDLAYGENKDQSPASLFREYDSPLALHKFEILTGDPGWVSMADGDRALGVMCALAEAFRINCGKVPFISVACKHGNACGIGVDFKYPDVSLRKALTGDPVAVMGAEFMTNFPINEDLGKIIYEVHEQHRQIIGRQYWGIDVLYAPSVDGATVALLSKKERRKVLVNPNLADPKLSPRMWMRREVEGGHLKQRNYHYILDLKNLAKATGNFGDNVVDMIIAWGATWRSVSNTVALAGNSMLLSLGDGQQDRIACAQLCLDRAKRARHITNGSSGASDGFFPYAKRSSENAPFEAPELLVQAGCEAVVVPYDGVRKEEVAEYFRQAGVAVAFVAPEHRGFFGH